MCEMSTAAPPMSERFGDRRPLSEGSAEIRALCEGVADTCRLFAMFADIGRMFASSAGALPLFADVRRRWAFSADNGRMWGVSAEMAPLCATPPVPSRGIMAPPWPLWHQGLTGQSARISRFRVLRPLSQGPPQSGGARLPSGQAQQALTGQSLKIARFRLLRLPRFTESALAQQTVSSQPTRSRGVMKNPFFQVPNRSRCDRICRGGMVL